MLSRNKVFVISLVLVLTLGGCASWMPQNWDNLLPEDTEYIHQSGNDGWRLFFEFLAEFFRNLGKDK